jgi:hypothetical protein
MTKPLFEWQREWDGTQPAVSLEERVNVSKVFHGFVRAMMTLPYAQPDPRRSGASRIDLTGSDTRGPIEIMVRQDVDRNEPNPFIALQHVVDLGPHRTPFRSQANIASWYMLGDDEAIVRDDFDTRPNALLRAMHDESLPEDPNDAAEALGVSIQQRTEALLADRALGFARQPIDNTEMSSLINYIGSAGR